MKLNLVHPTYILIILALSFFWWGTCQSSRVKELKMEQEGREHLEEVQKLQDMAKRKGARADSLEASFISRRTSDSVALSGLKMRNRGMSENVHILREPVQPLIDSIQALARFVRAYDSLLAGKDEEIKQLELRHEGQIIDLTTALKERGDQAIAEAQKAESWRLEAVDARKDERKEKRRKGFWKVTTAILGATVVYLSVK